MNEQEKFFKRLNYLIDLIILLIAFCIITSLLMTCIDTEEGIERLLPEYIEVEEK